MARRTVVRSILKLVGVAVLLVAALGAEVRASEEYCAQRAADCAQTCGTTVNWGTVWSYYYPCSVYIWQLDLCFGGFDPVAGVIFSNGIHQFECDEYSASSSCQCAY